VSFFAPPNPKVITGGVIYLALITNGFLSMFRFMESFTPGIEGTDSLISLSIKDVIFLKCSSGF